MNAANNHAPHGTRTNDPSALAHTSDQCFSSACGFDSREHFGESFAESVGLSEGAWGATKLRNTAFNSTAYLIKAFP